MHLLIYICVIVLLWFFAYRIGYRRGLLRFPYVNSTDAFGLHLQSGRTYEICEYLYRREQEHVVILRDEEGNRRIVVTSFPLPQTPFQYKNGAFHGVVLKDHCKFHIV